MSTVVEEREPTGVGVFVGLVAACAGIALFVLRNDIADAVSAHTGHFVLLLGVVLLLAPLSVDVYGKGGVSVSGVGLLTAGFVLGPGPAMVAALVAAAVHAAQYRPKPYRVLFNASTFALAAASGSAVLRLVSGEVDSWIALPAALLAGAAFTLVNLSLLSIAMSLVELRSPLSIFNERFRWLVPHYLVFGPLALAATVAFERIGVLGLAAFLLPPAMMSLSVRQYLNRTRESVEEVRQANEELRLANLELGERNTDLRDLLDFSQGLASRAHDNEALVRYAESTLAEVLSTSVRIDSAEDADGVDLAAGGKRVAALVLQQSETFDQQRWSRLSDVLLPNLATALESSQLVAEVSRRHLATIAALSRSIEAKDGYTGGHVERVSDITVAIGKRLGYTGADLDALEVGAVLHDVGKIGIPENIIRKEGPLDEDEWVIMRTHPQISEHILADSGLPTIVLEIARSSHERMDGAGYPDGLVGEQIPLAARIVLVADAYDALTTDRSYRTGRSPDEAMAEIRKNVGPQFCPRVATALERAYLEEPETFGAARSVLPFPAATSTQHRLAPALERSSRPSDAYAQTGTH